MAEKLEGAVSSCEMRLWGRLLEQDQRKAHLHLWGLFPRNEQADLRNQQELAKLTAAVRTFTCLDHFHWQRQLHPEFEHYGKRDRDGTLCQLKDNRLERRLHMKEGMQVMLVANLVPESRLVNRSQGKLVGYQQYDPDQLTETNSSSPNYLEIRGREHRAHCCEQIRKWIATQRKEDAFFPIVQFLDGQIRTIYPVCRVETVGDTKDYSLLSRTQIPLIPAWAITIHKSQGLSLDKVIIDLDEATSREMACHPIASSVS